MSVMFVCPTDRAAATAREHRPSHVLGLASPAGVAASLHLQDEAGGSGAVLPADHRLALAFHDIATPQPGLIAPSPDDIAAILAFGRTWDEARPMLVHCRMGISRSTAAALILAVDREPARSERRLAETLRAAASCATPNPLMIALADAALGRGGRLVAAAAAIGRGAEYVPQAGFAIDLAQAGRRAASRG